MKRGTIEHPKTLGLAGALGVRRYAAVGILESLWHWSAKYAPLGNVGKYTDDVIARGVDWEGDPAVLIEALASSGWIDRHATHRLLIHDWSDHADDTLQRALARAGQLFADGCAPSTSRLHKEEKAEADAKLRRVVLGARRARSRALPPLPLPFLPPPQPLEELGGKPPESPADTIAEEFEKEIRPAYPKRDGDQRWVQALSSYRVARRLGEPFETIKGGLDRYSGWCVHKGIVGTSSVKQAASFFGREKCWREAWPIVEQKKNGSARRLKLVSGREIVVPPGKRIEWTDNPQACDAYELPNGTLSVRSGASWVNA